MPRIFARSFPGSRHAASTTARTASALRSVSALRVVAKDQLKTFES